MVSNVPPGTASLALVMHDPDAPNGDFLHWTVWNMTATASVIPENRVPSGALQGTNGYGKIGYGQPAPPSGTHHYLFDLYALNVQLDLPAGASLKQLQQAMDGHIAAQTQLIGIVNA